MCEKRCNSKRSIKWDQRDCRKMISFGRFFILLMIFKECNTIPTPWTLPGITQMLTPFIRHWEPANFDRNYLNLIHENHLNQKHERRKRDLNRGEFTPFQTIRLNFSAHDREFRLVLKQDPLSVFANDVEIETTSGPIEYDISRVYSGTLEGDENSKVYAVLTKENLLDGTIETKTDFYYIEPSNKYSTQLADSGIHSIVYKVRDIKSPTWDQFGTSNEQYCASENFRKKLRKASIKQIRSKRWLPNELMESELNRNPPLPLDFEVPYNDGVGVVPGENESKSNLKNSSERNRVEKEDSVYRYNINDSTGLNDNNQTSQINNSANNIPKIYTKHKNIIISSSKYNRSILLNDNHEIISSVDQNGSSNNNRSFANTNWTTFFSNGRPIPKTHVEIITKNGATKKPNLIVNNYNPDFSSNVISTNFNNMILNNWFSGRNWDSDFNRANPIVNPSRPSYDRKITCMLYLQADHTFFQKMGSDEASIEAITRHVQRANAIYRNTDFNNDGKPDNITFMIKRIKVHNMNAVNDPMYRFPGTYGVEKFLEIFSEEDYDAFCLAYMFTYRDFEMGTLGLAWTGDLKNAGGVCEKNGHYRGSLKSLNTGIVTLLNYGKHVPPAVSHVTLAHEIGHNFGSPHDPVDCTPGGEDGNFIMFARATSGDKKNNNKFSKCSLKSIEPVLNSKARSAKGCFTEPQIAICGNGVVEPGEECDCGWEEDCKDICCFPMTRNPKEAEKPCTLSDRAMCSPSQGFCCTTDCKLKFGDKCRDDNGCRDPSFCDGQMPQCPPSVNKPNKTICNKEFVCYMGECTGSICLAYGLESCQCIPEPHEDKIKSCELCCKIPGEGNACISSFEWNDPPYDVPDMYAKPGTPCNDYNGYCDVYQKCREVDPSGPLATLRKILLSEENIATFKKWMQENWYTVALSGVGLFILLVLMTKLLAKRSSTKLKSITIIHSATTETVRLPEDKNEVIVHTALRSKVPLKKKVRGERLGKKSSDKANMVNIRRKPNKHSSKSSSNKVANLNSKVYSHLDNAKSEMVKSGRHVSKKHQPTRPEQERIKDDVVNKASSKKKETVINYASRNARGSLDASTHHPHMNTFGRVQKWLLESPVVTQSENQGENATVKNVIKKSHSTPDRLLQGSPKKSKGSGSAAVEKVKLEVVYKPPFRFALRFNKKGSVKTKVVSPRHKRIGKNILPLNSVSLSNSEDMTKIIKEKSPKAVTSPSVQKVNSSDEPDYETLSRNMDNFNKSSLPVEDTQNQQISISRDNSSSHIIKKSSSTQNLIRHPSQRKKVHQNKNRSSLNLKNVSSSKEGHRPSSINESRSTTNLKRVISDSDANINQKKNNRSVSKKQHKSNSFSSNTAFNNIPRASLSSNSSTSKASQKDFPNRRSLPNQSMNPSSLDLSKVETITSLPARSHNRQYLARQLSGDAKVPPIHKINEDYTQKDGQNLPKSQEKSEQVVSDIKSLVN